MIPTKYWNPICITIIIGMLVLIVLSSTLIFDEENERTERCITYMAAEFAGMILCTILFVSVLLDQRFNEATFYFMCMISFGFLSLFSELMFWHTTYVPVTDSQKMFFYYLEDLLFPGLIYMFWNYERNIIPIPDTVRYRTGLVMNGLLALSAILLIINLPTEFMFDVENGVYVTGVGSFLPFFAPFVMMAICIICALKYSDNRKHKYILIGYIMIPTVAVAVKLPDFSSSFTFLAILVSMILMFGEIYLDRGMTLVNNEAAMTEQRIAMMVSRIEPEFLEETLDSIASANGNPESTKNAIMEFKKYFRENINTISQKKPIHISQEMEHVHTYVNLEKLRFKEKLNVVFDLKDMDFFIPAMTIQMMTENAIKHGITQREEGGTVTIRSRDTPEAHIITVEDDGVGFDTSQPHDNSRSHIGMSNLSTRLKELVDGTFEVKSTPGVGTVATVTIPKF